MKTDSSHDITYFTDSQWEQLAQKNLIFSRSKSVLYDLSSLLRKLIFPKPSQSTKTLNSFKGLRREQLAQRKFLRTDSSETTRNILQFHNWNSLRIKSTFFCEPILCKPSSFQSFVTSIGCCEKPKFLQNDSVCAITQNVSQAQRLIFYIKLVQVIKL